MPPIFIPLWLSAFICLPTVPLFTFYRELCQLGNLNAGSLVISPLIINLESRPRMVPLLTFAQGLCPLMVILISGSLVISLLSFTMEFCLIKVPLSISTLKFCSLMILLLIFSLEFSRVMLVPWVWTLDFCSEKIVLFLYSTEFQPLLFFLFTLRCLHIVLSLDLALIQRSFALSPFTVSLYLAQIWKLFEIARRMVLCQFVRRLSPVPMFISGAVYPILVKSRLYGRLSLV